MSGSRAVSFARRRGRRSWIVALCFSAAFLPGTRGHCAPDETVSERARAGSDAPATDGEALATDADAAARWYLRPILPPDVPVRPQSASTNPIDRFLLAAMEDAAIEPTGAADRRVLLRRITFDLTGLPPTREETAAFQDDSEPGAWDRVIERLLASPEYGPRWGRHWLDVVRYADTTGDGTDMPIPEAWRYRDYVIQAFQDDLPYDAFIQEQLAGDLLAAESAERVRERRIATGFIALTRRFGNGTYSDMHLVIDNTIETVGQAFLAQGVQCARCHDHKFDPITTQDYFGWYGYFQNTQYPHGGSEHGKDRLWLVSLDDDPQRYAEHRERERRKQHLLARIDQIESDHGKEDHLAAEVTRTEKERAAREAEVLTTDEPASWTRTRIRDDQLRELLPLVEAHARALALHTELVESQAEFARLVRANEAVAELAWSVTDRVRSRGDASIQRAGDPNNEGEEVPRGFLRMVDPTSPKIAAGRSGRLELARWIASKENPLTARVMVNRIWHLHFGRGIVDTPNLFGAQGDRPSHPELLDWLAARFMDSGWSVKAMHRLILSSDAYRRAGSDDPARLAADPDNRLLARFCGRRLEGEAIRDTLLAVSGRLDRTPGGPHPFPPVEKLRYSQHQPFQTDYEDERRSVYLMTRRLGQPPVLGLFDPPDRNRSAGRRRSSTVPQQALFAMNSELVDQCARSFAARIRADGSDDRTRIAAAIAIAFQREIELAGEGDEAEGDLPILLAHLHRLREIDGEDCAWTAIARALLMSNELIYVD